MLLFTIGKRIRERRKVLKLTQGSLASMAQVSPRFLVQLESGKGNISLQRLSDLCAALELSLSELFRGLGPYGPLVICLVGLRGAGKTSIGRAAAARLKIPFMELDQKIVSLADMSLSEIFSFGDSNYYHELEKRALSEIFSSGKPCVLAAGGSIVTSENWTRLRDFARTAWLKASPETHLRRVQFQGDLRPMRGRSDALGELKQILSTREELYALADIEIDTEKFGIDGSAKLLQEFYQGG